MAVFKELVALDWPTEFVVEYTDGTTERLLRGQGIALTPAGDDPEGCGGFSAELPAKSGKTQKRIGRHVRFTELRSIHAPDGHRLWPVS